MLILTYISVKWNQRAWLGLFTQFWFLPCLVALAVLPEGTPRWGSYALVTVILSYPTRESGQNSGSHALHTDPHSASNASRMVQFELQHRPDANCLSSFIQVRKDSLHTKLKQANGTQHDGASAGNYSLEYLPRGRQTTM